MLLIYIKAASHQQSKGRNLQIQMYFQFLYLYLFKLYLYLFFFKLSIFTVSPMLALIYTPKGCNFMSKIICKLYQKTKHILYKQYIIHTVFLKCFLMSDVKKKNIYFCVHLHRILYCLAKHIKTAFYRV